MGMRYGRAPQLLSLSDAAVACPLGWWARADAQSRLLGRLGRDSSWKPSG
jgi:hypothetical protein